MYNMNGKLLQRSISKVLPNKVAAATVEILLLLLSGMIAITLYAKLRIPMHLPGKQGLLFIFIIVSARSTSGNRYVSSISCLGAASLLFFKVLGFDDPFMPFVYIALGFVLDFLFNLNIKFRYQVWLTAIIGGISWITIPILRWPLSIIFVYPYRSLASGLLYPVFTHFIFGFTGALLAGLLILSLSKKNKTA